MGHIVKGTAPASTATAVPAMAAAEAVAWLAQARAEAKATAVILARKMAEKIVGHAVTVDAAVMRDIAARALAAINPSSAPVLLRAHPEDLAALESTRQAWLDELGMKAEISFAADPEVGRYGCIVETPAGRVDARLETQLDALERALRGLAEGGA
jgi:flagellar biosynthesis/type III secretory pathway protein FliH